MDVDVLFLVRNLIEGEAAAGHWALVGSFSCVHTQVVEKVVPLPENFQTCPVVLQTHEHTHSATCRLI